MHIKFECSGHLKAASLTGNFSIGLLGAKWTLDWSANLSSFFEMINENSSDTKNKNKNSQNCSRFKELIFWA